MPPKFVLGGRPSFTLTCWGRLWETSMLVIACSLEPGASDIVTSYILELLQVQLSVLLCVVSLGYYFTVWFVFLMFELSELLRLFSVDPRTQWYFLSLSKTLETPFRTRSESLLILIIRVDLCLVIKLIFRLLNMTSLLLRVRLFNFEGTWFSCSRLDFARWAAVRLLLFMGSSILLTIRLLIIFRLLLRNSCILSAHVLDRFSTHSIRSLEIVYSLSHFGEFLL